MSAITKKLTDSLQEMKQSQERVIYLDKLVYLKEYRLDGMELHLTWSEVYSGLSIEQTMLQLEFESFRNKLQKPEQFAPTHVPKNIVGLRDIFMNNMAQLNAGKMDIKLAKEMANQAQVIINMTKLELQYYREFNKEAPEKIKFIEK